MGGGTQPARQAPPPSICMRACGNAPPPFRSAPCTCNGAAQNPKASQPGGAEGKQTLPRIACAHDPTCPTPTPHLSRATRTSSHMRGGVRRVACERWGVGVGHTGRCVGLCAHPLPGDARAGNNAEATRTIHAPLKWESDKRRGAEMVSARTAPLFPHAPPSPVSTYRPLRGMKDWVACKPRGEGLSRRVCRPCCVTVSPQTVACRGSTAALGRGGMRDQEDTHAPHPSCRAQRDSTPFHHVASRLRKKKYIVNVNYISQ